jgi:hypothetical protein
LEGNCSGNPGKPWSQNNIKYKLWCLLGWLEKEAIGNQTLKDNTQ